MAVLRALCCFFPGSGTVFPRSGIHLPAEVLSNSSQMWKGQSSFQELSCTPSKEIAPWKPPPWNDVDIFKEK
jgi:NADH dehydrogenase (ubiquinone) Fe-S protein 2